MKNEDCLRDISENIKCTNIYVIGVPEREKREKEAENLFQEIMAKNFLNLGERNRYPGPGPESPKQDKPKKIHSKTYHNLNGKS